MAKTTHSLPSVSVVVPYFENQEGLNRLLEALDAQTYSGRLECIVADDGSMQPPLIPERIETPVRIVRQENRGFRAAAARNLGAAAASGEILAFIDGDTVPRPDYVSSAVAPVKKDPLAVVVGTRLHSDGQEPRWLREAWQATDDLLDANDSSWRFIISAVLTCSRAFFERVGGFDATIVGYGGEDWEFAWRCWNAGAQFIHQPSAIADHPENDWGARYEDKEQAYAQKNVETRALARRITHPLARPSQAFFEVPDTVVLFPADYSTWPVGVADAVIIGWLAQPDTHVVLPGEGEEAGLFAADPRVKIKGSDDMKLMERARFQMRLSAPAHPEAEDAQGFVLVRDTEGLGGNVVLKNHNGRTVAQVTSARFRALATTHYQSGEGAIPAEVTARWQEYEEPIRLEGFFAGWD
ncbi:glycosyltransferase [Rothia amarae]|uniref:glycosyltransferase n=1 Tax=Rothia amarae TaxID=169480 RepID=UPI0031D55EA0